MHQALAAGLRTGMRFHSAPVIRLADAKPMQLGHALKADGRWRLIAFAAKDDAGQVGGSIATLCDFLANNTRSPIHRITPKGADIDSVLDLRVVFQASHREMNVEALPPLLKPTKGKYGLVDYEKAFCPDLKHGPDIFDQRQIDRAKGALVIVRPDQFVAEVLPLDAFDDITTFFGEFMVAV